MSQLLLRRASYLGQAATRCQLPRDLLTGAGRWQMTRSGHFAREKLVNPTVVFPNYLITSGNAESAQGAGTIKASIEYPLGTLTLANENIAAGAAVAFPAGNTALTFNVTIPNGAKFGVRVLQQNSNGVLYSNYESTYCADALDAWESGTSTVSDKTESGTFTANVITYHPIVIATTTRRPSVLLLGDSREAGGTEGATDLTFDVGPCARAVGRVYGYSKFVRSGSRLDQYLAASRTYRDALVAAGYWTHAVNEYGVNDLGGGGRTPAQLAADDVTLAALYTNVVHIGTTLMPYNTSTDGWFTTANQNAAASNNVKVLAYNDLVRAGIVGQQFYWDISDAIDPFRKGLWPVTLNPNDSTIGGTQGQVTASIAGTVMTVTATAAGGASFVAGETVIGSLVGLNQNSPQPGTVITSVGTYNGTSGTLNVNKSQTVASQTFYTGGRLTNDGLHQTQLAEVLIQRSGVINLDLVA